ncbi:MAG: hypothetical protein ACI8W3_002186 [Myxococcota bacterium]
MIESTFRPTLPVLRTATVMLAILLVCGGGCASNLVDPMELPDELIAVQWWENEDARRRKEIEARFEGGGQARRREGVMDLNRFGSRGANAADPNALNRYPGKLALINPRTGEITFPEQTPPGAKPLSWSADRRRLLFSSSRQNGRFQIFELDFDTLEVRLLTGSRGNILAAAHGPNGSFVYSEVQMNDAGELQLEIVKNSADNRDELLADDAAARHLSYSRDGRQVAYAPYDLRSIAGGATSAPRIVVQDLTPGGAKRQIGVGEHPIFSPDGSWIIYSARRGENRVSYRVRPDGSGRTALGIGVRSEETPAVSPDGNFVIYISEHNGLDRLFVKRFDGSGDRLLFDDATVGWPVW